MEWRKFLGVEWSIDTEFVGLYKYLDVHIKYMQTNL